MIRLNEAEKLLFSKINLFSKKKDDSEVYISGGWVRDKLINQYKSTTDIDIVLNKEKIPDFLEDLKLQFQDIEKEKNLSEKKKKRFIWKKKKILLLRKTLY